MTTTRGGYRDYRWRRLTPEQAAAIRDARTNGVSAKALAMEYSVNVRTIYRAVTRADEDVIAEAQLPGWRASYALTDEGPVQLTPWFPTDA